VKSLALYIGILLLASLVGYLVFSQVNHPALSYSPSDIAYGKPLHVVHQVEATPASNQVRVIEKSPSASPHLEVPLTFYDFGLVSPTQTVTRVFEMANRGTGPLVITAAYTTCACTTADLTATEVPSGKVVLVTVRFDASVHDLTGQTIRRGLILETNDPQYPNVEFWVQATVK
jgi:hypothetical protein